MLAVLLQLEAMLVACDSIVAAHDILAEYRRHGPVVPNPAYVEWHDRIGDTGLPHCGPVHIRMSRFQWTIERDALLLPGGFRAVWIVLGEAMLRVTPGTPLMAWRRQYFIVRGPVKRIF